MLVETGSCRSCAQGPWGDLWYGTTFDFTVQKVENGEIEHIMFLTCSRQPQLPTQQRREPEGLAGGGKRGPTRMMPGELNMVKRCVDGHLRLDQAVGSFTICRHNVCYKMHRMLRGAPNGHHLPIQHDGSVYQPQGSRKDVKIVLLKPNWCSSRIPQHHPSDSS